MILRATLTSLMLLHGASTAVAQHNPLAPVVPAAAIHSARSVWLCPGMPVRVHGRTPTQNQQVCDAAKLSADVLATCGLYQARAIEVYITDNVFLRSGSRKWGEFLPGASSVRILSSAMHKKVARSQFDNTDMPATEHYAGIVAHEVAHAIFYELSQELELPETAHEYIAYVVQIMSYSEETRRRILAREPPIPSSNLFVFSHFLRLADPHRFGVNAYAHFTQPENGCALLGNVLQGKVHFPPGSD